MGMSENCFVVVPWVHQQERVAFLEEWGIKHIPDWLVLQHDQYRCGCGATKNAGIQNAIELGAEIVVVVDSDCFPSD